MPFYDYRCKRCNEITEFFVEPGQQIDPEMIKCSYCYSYDMQQDMAGYSGNSINSAPQTNNKDLESRIKQQMEDLKRGIEEQRQEALKSIDSYRK